MSVLWEQIRIEDIGPHAQCDLGIYLLPRDNALVPEDGRSHGLKSIEVTNCRFDLVVELDLVSVHDLLKLSLNHLVIVGDVEKQAKDGGPNNLDVLVESNLYRYGLPGRIARAVTGSRDHLGFRGLSGHVYPVAGLDVDCLMSHLGVRVVRDVPDRCFVIELQAVRLHAYPVLVKVARPHRVREHKRSRQADVRVVLGLAVTLHDLESVAPLQGVYPEDHAGFARNRDRLRERYSNLYLIATMYSLSPPGSEVILTFTIRGTVALSIWNTPDSAR